MIKFDDKFGDEEEIPEVRFRKLCPVWRGWRTKITKKKRTHHGIDSEPKNAQELLMQHMFVRHMVVGDRIYRLKEREK